MAGTRVFGVLALTTALAGCSFDVPAVGYEDPTPADPIMMQPLFPAADPTPPGPTPPTPPGAPAVKVGDPCSPQQPCGPGGRCITDLPGRDSGPISGGYCTVDCRNTACPAGSVCQDFGKDKLCMQTCTGACGRDSLSCCQHQNALVCLPDDACDDD
jgi:hypothetical protein